MIVRLAVPYFSRRWRGGWFPGRIAGAGPSALFAVLLLLAALLAGCVATPQVAKERDGKLYGVTRGLFNYRWWNYYERGLSFAAGEFWAEAEADLREALRQRPRDQRRARTYGLHFVDYFPKRELGILCYRTGRMEAAIDLLRRSLAEVDTAKAKYYLNLARRARLQETGGDTTPPVIRLAVPATGTVTNHAAYQLRATVSDDGFVGSVAVDGRPLFLELAEQRLEATRVLDLRPGPNPVTVTARDLAGNQAEARCTIVLDLAGPALTVTQVRQQADGLVVAGVVTDTYGLAELVLDGHRETVAAGSGRHVFQRLLRGHRLTGFAVDRAGNRSTVDLDLADTGPGLAAAGFFLSPSPAPVRCAVLGSLWPVTAAVPPTPPPAIRFTDLADEQETFLERLLPEGDVVAGEPVTAITVNGEPLDFEPGRRVHFNHLLDLAEGDNRVTVTAATASATASSTVLVRRKVAAVRQAGARLNVGVAPFAALGGGTYAGIAADLFQETLLRRGRFHLVSREHLEEVLRELKLSASGLVDPATAQRLGRLVAADGLLAGKVLEDKQAFEATVQLVNSETASLLATVDVYDEAVDLGRLRYLMEGLALKLEAAVPLQEGLIIKVSGSKYVLDLGKNAGLRPEMQVIAFRQGEPIVHPVTGKVLGADTEELGTLVVGQVADDYAVAAPKGQVGEIRAMDRFITR